MTGSLEYETVLRRVVSLLEQVAGDTLAGPVCDVGPGSVRRLGLTSVQLLHLLIAIEDEFGVIWDEDVDESVISSIEEMTRYIVAAAAQLARGGAGKRLST